MSKPIKLHLGCGWRDFGKDWFHIDGGDYEHLDYTNITKLHAFDDNTVDLIYASHVIEYFDRIEIVPILEEWRRVLKVGGTIRLAVPDFLPMADLYMKRKVTIYDILGPLFGKMLMDDATIYHKTTYDMGTLSILLEAIGFSQIKRYDWRETEHAEFDDHSQAYIPHMDKENGMLISLNVEAVKV